MTKEQYVNQVVKQIKCGGAKKKDIKRQLLADIEMHSSQGEKMEDILASMGSVKEVADGFNESLSPDERKRYFRNKAVKIVIPIVLVVVLLVGAFFMSLPKGTAIEDSVYFTKEQVEAAIKQTITWLDDEDYASLQANAIEQMAEVLNKETMDEAKRNISDDWGERLQFGTLYAQELTQGNTHYAVGQITVNYENVSATYTITYDADMKLAGLYMR